MGKRWTSCISCDFQSKCEICKSRLDNFDKTSYAAEDVGCFNFEMYKQQQKKFKNKQLKLFKM